MQRRTEEGEEDEKDTTDNQRSEDCVCTGQWWPDGEVHHMSYRVGH